MKNNELYFSETVRERLEAQSNIVNPLPDKTLIKHSDRYYLISCAYDKGKYGVCVMYKKDGIVGVQSCEIVLEKDFANKIQSLTDFFGVVPIIEK